MTLIIDRYIVRSVLAATVVVVAVVAALVSLMLFISQVSDIGDGHYTLAKVVVWVFLRLPERIYLTLPVVVLLGALLALGALAAGSELVVIRSAGVSMNRLAVSVGMAGLVLAICTAFLGEVAVPLGMKNASMLRDKAVHGEIHRSVAGGGLWLRNNGYFLHIDTVLPGGRIHGLNVYRLGDEGRLILAVSADTARLSDHKLIADRSAITNLGHTQAVAEQQAEFVVPVTFKPDVLRIAVTQPSELSSYGLWKYIDYLHANNIDARDYQLSLWRNIVTPFTVWILVIFALPFAFGSLRSASAGQRLFVGGLIGLLFFLINEIVVSAGPVYGLPPWFAASLPTVLLALGTGYWLRRLN